MIDVGCVLTAGEGYKGIRMGRIITTVFCLASTIVCHGCAPETAEKDAAPQHNAGASQAHAAEVAPESRIQLPNWVPGDVPIYRNCVLLACSRGAKAAAIQIRYSVNELAEDVEQFYEKNAVHLGWTPEALAEDESENVLAYHKNGRYMRIEIEDGPAKTYCTVYVTK